MARRTQRVPSKSSGSSLRTDNDRTVGSSGAGPRPHTESATALEAGNLDVGPGEDELVSEDTDLTVVQHVRECFREARDAARMRRKQSEINWYAYMGLQDWSGKVKGQSREFIPKTPIAVDQLAYFIKKALTAFGNWFQIDVSRNAPPQAQILTGEQIRDLIQVYLEQLPDGLHDYTTFDVRMADAVKVGVLQSLMIFKIYGSVKTEKRYTLGGGDKYFTPLSQTAVRAPLTLKAKESDHWRLCIDLIRPDDYYPDPSGAGLYEIHKVERDIHEIVELAEQGIYDWDAVEQLQSSVERASEERRKDSLRGQERTVPPDFRKKIVLMEYWGTLLRADGRIAQKNIVCTIANDLYLIRPPEPNPFWHGESPFVVCPIIRVPFSVWHKALYDHASGLNFAINEMFNLIMDGGIASVWGTRQVRADMLEDPDEITAGVPQGVTLSVKNELPAGEKVLEVVATGAVPQDAMAVYEAMNREFEAAALTNELKLGQMPSKRVLATEVMATQEGQSTTLEGISGIMEQQCIEKVLRKSWLCILQDADNLLSEDVVNAIGAPAAVSLRRMKPAERFAAFAGYSDIKVYGLHAVLAKAQEFQKQAALMQIVMNNPLLAQAYQKRFSSDRQLDFLMKSLNINPEDVEKTPEEIQENEQEMARTQQMGQIINGPGGGTQVGGQAAQGNASTTGGAGPGMASEVNQAMNPLDRASP